MYLLVDPKVLRFYIRTNIRRGLYRLVECEHCLGSIVKMAIDRFTIYWDVGIYDTGWPVRSFGLYVLIDCLFEGGELLL